MGIIIISTLDKMYFILINNWYRSLFFLHAKQIHKFRLLYSSCFEKNGHSCYLHLLRHRIGFPIFSISIRIAPYVHAKSNDHLFDICQVVGQAWRRVARTSLSNFGDSAHYCWPRSQGPANHGEVFPLHTAVCKADCTPWRIGSPPRLVGESKECAETVQRIIVRYS